MKLTVERMDAAIRRLGPPFTTPMDPVYRAVFLAGLKAASRIVVPFSGPPDDDYLIGLRQGRDKTLDAIGEAEKRLRKEAGL